MLRVEADHRFAGFQQVFQEQLQEKAFALAGVAEDEHAAVGLVLGAPVEVHDDIAPIAVLADVKAVRIGLAGIVDGIEVGHRRSRKHPLILAAETVPARGVDRLKALLLPQKDAVRGELGSYQLCQNLVLQRPQSLRVPRRQLDEHGAVHQRLPIAVHRCDERRNVL